MNLSKHGRQLIKLYADMVNNGIDTKNDSGAIQPEDVYNSFQLKRYRKLVVQNFKNLNIETVLDYGAGGSNWDALNFNPETGETAKQFFGVRQVVTFEPARKINKKIKSECVVCMDVLEHIFLADVAPIIRELFSLSEKLLVINVACYEANALLPTGENAHITIREPSWWLGVISSISIEFPEIEVLLICSETFDSGVIYNAFKAQDWHGSQLFTIENEFVRFGTKQLASLQTSEILQYVDLLTQQQPAVGSIIQRILQKNLPN